MLRNNKINRISIIIVIIAVGIALYYNPLTQFILSYKKFKDKEQLLFESDFYKPIASVLVKCCSVVKSTKVVELEKSVFPQNINMLYQFKYADASHQGAHLLTGGGAVNLGYFLVPIFSGKHNGQKPYGWTLYAWTSSKRTNNKPICEIFLMGESDISYKTNAIGRIIMISDNFGLRFPPIIGQLS